MAHHMFFSKTTRVFGKNIFPFHFLNRQVLLFQSPNFTSRSSRPDLFQSLPYANSLPSNHTSPEGSTSSSYINKLSWNEYFALRRSRRLTERSVTIPST